MDINDAPSFYIVDEFFTCTDDMYYWLYDCVNVSYTNIFIVCMFMTCSTSYCLVTLKDLWNVYMYVCKYMALVKTLPSNNLIFSINYWKNFYSIQARLLCWITLFFIECIYFIIITCYSMLYYKDKFYIL
jgi:hypothetical protein